jgi:hypothetical protein
MLMEIAVFVSLLSQATPANSSNRAVPTTMRAETHHDKAFWRMIVKNEFKPPAGSTTTELAFELSKALGAQDSELRDDLAYTILTAWIYKTRQVDVPTLRLLESEWLGNLKVVSGPEPDAVLRRSFSALMLSVVVARDNAEPFLEKQEWRNIWDAALSYLAAETDLRGFDNRIGWIHSAAHTADLLKFLGRSRYVEREDQAVLLAAVRRKLSSAPVVFTYGEDERYARTVLSVILRKDFDLEGFEKWTKDIRSKLEANTEPNEPVLHGQQNIKNFLAKLDFILVSVQAEQGPGVKAAEEAVRAALRGTF